MTHELCLTILAMNIVASNPTDIFLKEVNLVAKFWVEEMDKDESLSKEEEQVQTSRRLRHPSKTRVKANNKTSKACQGKQRNHQ